MTQPRSARTLLWRTILGVAALVLGIYLLNRHESTSPTVTSPTPTPPAATTESVAEPTSAPDPTPTPATTAPLGDGIALLPPRVDVSSPKQVDSAAPAIAFVDGGSLIIARPAGEIQLRGLGNSPVQILGAKHPRVRAISIQNGGDAVALGGADSLTIFHRRSNSETTLAAKDVTAAAFSSDGRTLITGHGGGELRLWDAISWTQVATMNPGVGAIRAISYSADGRSIAAAGNGVAVWDAAARTPKTKLAPADTCTGVAFSPDGRLIAVAAGGGVTIYETTFWQKQGTVAARIPCSHVAFWRGGNAIVTVGVDGTIQLWDVPTRRSLIILPAAAGAISSLSLSPDDRTVAAGGAGGVVIWDSTTRASRRLN